ncbi:hypothetical protein Bca4012_092185 [Brassica carinata]
MLDTQTSTKDRMGRWELDVLAQCVLCFASALDRENLFFQCVYNGEIWSYFLNRLNFPMLSSFDATLSWLGRRRPFLDPNMVVILTLVYQTSMYSVWKERNARTHASSPHTPQSLITEIKDTIRLRLDPSSDQRGQSILFKVVLDTIFFGF